MWTLALWSRKGGAGKSTLACSLAAYAVSKGQRVALVDADPQQSIASWDRNRKAEGSPLVLSASLARLPEAVAAAAAERFVGAIVDLPGSLGPGEVKALAVADLVLVPLRPSPFDLAATVESLSVLAAAGVRAAVVLTQVRPRSRETTDTRKALGKRSSVLRSEIGERVAFQAATSVGLGVTEYAPRSAAAAELQALYAEIRRTIHAK